MKFAAAAGRGAFFSQISALEFRTAGLDRVLMTSAEPVKSCGANSGTMAMPRPFMAQVSKGMSSSLRQKILGSSARLWK